MQEYVTIEPDVKVRVTSRITLFGLFGNFEAEQSYTVTMDSGVKDIWGDVLGYEYTFSFTGAPLETFRPATYQGNGVLFVNPDHPLISAQVVNVDQVSVLAGEVNLDQFLYMPAYRLL